MKQTIALEDILASVTHRLLKFLNILLCYFYFFTLPAIPLIHIYHWQTPIMHCSYHFAH